MARPNPLANLPAAPNPLRGVLGPAAVQVPPPNPLDTLHNRGVAEAFLSSFPALDDVLASDPPLPKVLTPTERMDNAMMVLSNAPVVGDALGFGYDVGQMISNPERRTWGNAALAGMGLLPFIPAAHTVYHGSPHKFDAFDASHIGRGEGAQAYGHGVYFAERPGVAKSYQDRLSQSTHLYDAAFELGNQDIPQQGLSFLAGLPDTATVDDALEELATWARKSPGEAAALDQTADWLRGNRAAVDDVMTRGAFYTADIPDDWLPRMLDWDAPLSEQAWFPTESADEIIARVKAEGRAPTEIEKAAVSIKRGTMPDKTGKVWYNDLVYKARDRAIDAGDIPATTLGASQAGASELLRQADIPGIKYYDAGSRAAGEGTRNYVVFPGMEQNVTILERQ